MRELKNDLMLIGVAEEFMNSVQSLDYLTDQVPELPTEQLGIGYAMIKAYEKNFDALIKKVRDEFIGDQYDDKSYVKNGRLFLEPTSRDDKGNPELLLPDGTLLKASRSQSNDFDEVAARRILEAHGLTELGSDKSITVLESSVTDFVDFLNLAIKDYAQFGFLAVGEVEEQLKNTFRVSYKPNPAKIEALILTGQLPAECVDQMFSVRETYSLLVSKNPYKPKKRK